MNATIKYGVCYAVSLRGIKLAGKRLQMLYHRGRLVGPQLQWGLIDSREVAEH